MLVSRAKSCMSRKVYTNRGERGRKRRNKGSNELWARWGELCNQEGLEGGCLSNREGRRSPLLRSIPCKGDWLISLQRETPMPGEGRCKGGEGIDIKVPNRGKTAFGLQAPRFWKPKTSEGRGHFSRGRALVGGLGGHFAGRTERRKQAGLKGLRRLYSSLHVSWGEDRDRKKEPRVGEGCQSQMKKILEGGRVPTATITGGGLWERTFRPPQAKGQNPQNASGTKKKSFPTKRPGSVAGSRLRSDRHSRREFGIHWGGINIARGRVGGAKAEGVIVGLKAFFVSRNIPVWKKVQKSLSG